MPHPGCLTSLLRVEERLLEAEYFTRRLARQTRPETFGYEFNAFLSAARSVTFLLQKELAHVNGFDGWWNCEREVLQKDDAARFFLELRNFSQKEGRVPLIGVGLPKRGRRRGWSHRFAGTSQRVPSSLYNRDVVDCCREHLAKLAHVVLRCADAFPYSCCPRRALTVEGVNALDIDLDVLDVAFGFPAGLSAVRNYPREDRIRFFADRVDAVDFVTIERISRTKARPRNRTAADDWGEAFASSLVQQFHGSSSRDEGHPVQNAIALEAMKAVIDKGSK